MKFLRTFFVSFFLLTSTALAVPTHFDFKSLPPHLLQGKAPNFATAKLVIVDFWASWCTPCLASLPFYDEMNKKYQDRGVVFLSLSADEDRKDAEKFLKKVSFSFPAYWDEGRKITRYLQLESIPVLLAVAPDGKILGRERGYTEKKKKEFPGKLEAWLKKAQ